MGQSKPKPQHQRNITPADIEAAKRLRAIWDAIPKSSRPTQEQLAGMWGEGANQSLISQYMGGKIALNLRAVLFFAKALGVKPTDIRDDLPEQQIIPTALLADMQAALITLTHWAQGQQGGPDLAALMQQTFADAQDGTFGADLKAVLRNR